MRARGRGIDEGGDHIGDLLDLFDGKIEYNTNTRLSISSTSDVLW